MRVRPVRLSTIVTVNATLVLADRNTQKSVEIEQASSTLTITSQLAGLKNQKRPESGELDGTDFPSAGALLGAVNCTVTLKRESVTQSEVGPAMQSPRTRPSSPSGNAFEVTRTPNLPSRKRAN